jgi:hypothetical protein
VRVLRSTISSVLAKPDPSAAREAAKETRSSRRGAPKEKEAANDEAEKA